MATVLLPLPYGRTFEFDVEPEHEKRLLFLVGEILSAYFTVKKEFFDPSSSHDLGLRIEEIRRQLLQVLPDLDESPPANLIYIYITLWFSETFKTHPGEDFLTNSIEMTGNSIKQPPAVPPEDASRAISLKAYLAYSMAFIIAFENSDSPPKFLFPTEDTSDKKGKRPARKKFHIPNAFYQGVATVPNNPVIAAGLKAIFKGGEKARQLLGGWTQKGSRVFFRQRHRSGRGEITYYPFFTGYPSSGIQNAETLWEFVEQLNPFTADVALAILAQLCEPSTGNRPKYPLRESVTITAEAILKYKGIQRYGKDRRIMEKRVYEEIERLRTLYFDMVRYPLPWHQGDGIRYEGDRLFDIVKVETYQLQLFGKEEVIETAWSVRAGQWAEHFFNSEKERIWTSRMAKILIEMDHRKQRKTAQLAKKIGYLLLTVPGGTAHRNRPVTRRIDGLLEEIGELPAHEYRTKDWAGRLRDNLLRAWELLIGAGLIKEISFPDGFGFEDTDRTKGWVEDWLCSRVTIITPEAAPKIEMFRDRTYRKRRTISKNVRIKPSNLQLEVGTPVFRKKIRDACQERYVTQKNLAKSIGIAPSTLSNILSGRTLPSMELARRLSDWLNKE